MDGQSEDVVKDEIIPGIGLDDKYFIIWMGMVFISLKQYNITKVEEVIYHS